MEISVLTWNVLAPMWVIPRFYKHVDPTLLETKERVQKIVRTIQQKNADVLMLQEFQSCDSCSELDPLWEFLLENYELMNFATFKDECGGEIMSKDEFGLVGGYQDHGCAIWVSKTSKLEWVKVHAEEYLVDSEGFIASIVVLREKTSNIPVIFVNCHLNWGPGRTPEQIKSIQERLDYFEKVEGFGKMVIWAGDFNRGVKSDAAKLLRETLGYKDVTNLFPGHEDAKTFLQVGMFNRRLDYIYLSKSLQDIAKVEYCEIDKCPKHFDTDEPGVRRTWCIGQFGSDHMNILAKVKFQNRVMSKL